MSRSNSSGRMKLTSIQREKIRLMFGGRCAYCGCVLNQRWHVDHAEAVIRESAYVKGKGFLQTGKIHCPENDTMANLMPACPPCNIDKNSGNVDDYRVRVSRMHETLLRNSSTYRHIFRHGRIWVNDGPVVFYFEQPGTGSTA